MQIGQEIFILYGLTLKISKSIRSEVEKRLEDRGYQFHAVCRYRKEGIYQYAAASSNDITIVIEEDLQGASPYEIEELIRLTDIGTHKVIYLLNAHHYGTEYMKFIYSCGILNAVFLSDVTAKYIAELILCDRSREEARNYYGISQARDQEKDLNIINENYLDPYTEYIEKADSLEEMNNRYNFSANRLGEAENKVLANSLDKQIRDSLRGNKTYQRYYKNEKQRGSFFRFKKKSYETAKVPKQSFPEKSVQEEAPISLLDRFQLSKETKAESIPEEPKKDLRIELGGFLQKIEDI